MKNNDKNIIFKKYLFSVTTQYCNFAHFGILIANCSGVYKVMNNNIIVTHMRKLRILLY